MGAGAGRLFWRMASWARYRQCGCGSIGVCLDCLFGPKVLRDAHDETLPLLLILSAVSRKMLWESGHPAVLAGFVFMGVRVDTWHGLRES